MDDGLRTSRAVRERAGLRDRVAHWFLLHGDREVVAGLVVVAVVVVVGGLVALGVLAVGPSSSAATVLGSGLTAGVVTLVTIALSINQLILSRVFGSPNELADRLAGTHDLRRLVERHADRPSSPNDPAAFLSLTATTLSVRAADLQAAIAASAWEPPGAVASAIQDVVDYGRNVDRHLEDRTDIVDVLDVVLGTGYARNMTAVRHLGEAYDESLSPAARQHLEAVDELLEAVAVARQFFKTLAI